MKCHEYVVIRGTECKDVLNVPFQGFHGHLGGGAVAAKITANVWEIVQLPNLVTPL